MRERGLLLLLTLPLVACSPVLDWRELRPEGAQIAAMFPCRPDRHARNVPLAGQVARMEMLVCPAGGSTYALSFADLDTPDAAATALDELRQLAVRNLGGEVSVLGPASVRGMTAYPQAARLAISGHLPDGAAIQERVVVFGKGARVYQASIVGPQLPADAVDPFFEGLVLGD